MRPLRKVRGALLRVVLNRGLAVSLGLLLALPGIWLWLDDFAWETWWTDGTALIAVATGSALMLAGLGGRRPDWIDPGSDPSNESRRDD